MYTYLLQLAGHEVHSYFYSTGGRNNVKSETRAERIGWDPSTTGTECVDEPHSIHPSFHRLFEIIAGWFVWKPYSYPGSGPRHRSILVYYTADIGREFAEAKIPWTLGSCAIPIVFEMTTTSVTISRKALYFIYYIRVYVLHIILLNVSKRYIWIHTYFQKRGQEIMVMNQVEEASSFPRRTM